MVLANLLKPGLLVTPRHEQWLATNHNPVYSPKVLDFVQSQLSEKQRERRYTISASSLGSCKRAQVLRFVGSPGKDTFATTTISIFHQGAWTHLKWQAAGLSAGWLAQAEIVCQIPDLNLTGTIDGLLDTKQGWEFKTANPRSYRQILAANKPKPEHLLQTHGYMMATGIRTWSVVYEDKGTQDWKEYVVEYDDEIAQAVRSELEQINDHASARTLPPMLEPCTRGEGSTFRQCPFKDTCPAMGSRIPRGRIVI